MYAYKYQTTEYQEVRYNRPLRFVKKNKPKKRRFNLLKRFVALFVTLPLLIIFALYVLPVGVNRLSIPLFFGDRMPFLKTNESYPVQKNYVPNQSVNVQDIIFPTVNSLENEYFLGSRMFIKNYAPTSNVGMTDLYLTDVIYDLKVQLMNLGKSYTMLTPTIFVWDFNSGNYVDINANMPYPAASVIKIPVLVSLFKSVEVGAANLQDSMVLTDYYRSSGSGHIQYFPKGATYTVDKLAKVMMQDSDNTATNMIMSKIGSMSSVNADMRSWGLNDTYIKTWLPDLNGTNVTSARDIAKILCNLDNPSFLDVNSRGYIYDYMSSIKNNSLIPKGMPEGIPFVHKTGDIGNMLADAGIVHLPNGKRYIIVIMVKRPHNSLSAVAYIQKASNIVYNHFSK